MITNSFFLGLSIYLCFSNWKIEIEPEMPQEVKRLVLDFMLKKEILSICYLHSHGENERAIVVPLYEVLLMRKTIRFYKFCSLLEVYFLIMGANVIIEGHAGYSVTTLHVKGEA